MERKKKDVAVTLHTEVHVFRYTPRTYDVMKVERSQDAPENSKFVFSFSFFFLFYLRILDRALASDPSG